MSLFRSRIGLYAALLFPILTRVYVLRGYAHVYGRDGDDHHRDRDCVDALHMAREHQ